MRGGPSTEFRGSVEQCFAELDRIFQDRLREAETAILVGVQGLDVDELDTFIATQREAWAVERDRCRLVLDAAVEKRRREFAGDLLVEG